MTEEELEAIEARANAATPGPWHYVDDQPRYKGVIRPVGQGWREVGVCAFGNEWLLTEDEQFITSARTDVPVLVAEVRRLRALVGAGAAEVKRLQAEVRRVRGEVERQRAELDRYTERDVQQARDGGRMASYDPRRTGW